MESRILNLRARPLSFDFKWTDNINPQADAMNLLDHGDAAPNARFNFRWVSPVQ